VFASAPDMKRNIFEQVVQNHGVQLLQFKVIPIYYADTNEIYKFLVNKKYKFLSENGVVSANQNFKKLFIKDDEKHIKNITDIIKRLDVPKRQILIKARIVNIETRSLKELGLSFSSHTVNKTKDGFVIDLPKIAAGEVSLPLIKLKTNALIDLKLNALEQTGHARILAKPELTMLDHVTAFIQSGEEVPYEEKTQSGGTSVIFKKAALQLKVTPEILPNNKILLKLNVTQDKVSTLNITRQPLIHTQKIETQVLVDNQQTIALGGIFEEMTDKNQKNTPILSHMPIIGLLFKHRFHTMEHKELIIFVTPSIL
jgi:type IV pilus assembly protein PilQ